MYGMGTSDCVALNSGEKAFLQEMMKNGFCCYPHVVENSYLTFLTLPQVVRFCAGFGDTFAVRKEIAKKRRKRFPIRVLIDTIPSHPCLPFSSTPFGCSGTP